MFDKNSKMLGRSIELCAQDGNWIVGEVGSSAINLVSNLVSQDKKLIARFCFDAFFIGFIAKLDNGSLALGTISSEVVCGGFSNSDRARIYSVVVVDLDTIRRTVAPDLSSTYPAGTFYGITRQYTDSLKATPEQLQQLLALHEQASRAATNEKELFCSLQQIADVRCIFEGKQFNTYM